MDSKVSHTVRVSEIALTTTREVARSKLQARLDLAQRGSFCDFDIFRDVLWKFEQNVLAWDDYNISLLDSLFTTVIVAQEYKATYPNQPGRLVKDALRERHLMRRASARRDFIVSLVGRLEFFGENQRAISRASVASAESSNRVFIIHGHDSLLKSETARLVQAIGLEPIILHEQPNGGTTLIEKFEKHADVGFAIALFTPDDYGGAMGDRAAGKPHEQRARQNVVLETGFFYGKLGRGRVAVLHKDSTAVLTDLSGIVYIAVDTVGKWKHDLAKELEHAGYKVNHSKVV